MFLARPTGGGASKSPWAAVPPLLEFNREVLEALQEPLEEHVVTVTRVAGAFYLANFIFVGSINPCPCS
jgi:predicted ATPase with chaperone activity